MPKNDIQMTAEDFAKKLDGREVGNEITEAERDEARNSGLLVVFGYSDDNVEFSGMFEDECSSVGEIFFTRTGLIGRHVDCECEFCGFKDATKTAFSLESKFGTQGWMFKTKLPHFKFKVMDDGIVYGEGLVIQLPRP
jgi:hypothetical protein